MMLMWLTETLRVSVFPLKKKKKKSCLVTSSEVIFLYNLAGKCVWVGFISAEGLRKEKIKKKGGEVGSLLNRSA